MDDTPIPHARWASVYDVVNEQSFGDAYHQLTAATVEQIGRCISPPARIVDFGAGTGRLSIPLASLGHQVVAVEPCREMLDQLCRRPGAEQVTAVVATMEDFQAQHQFEMVLCVFTVLAYLLDDEALEKSIANASQALGPGGHFLIDIPSTAVFRSYWRHTDTVDRCVTITPNGNDSYLYEEQTIVGSGADAQSCADRFLIRYWHIDHVMAVLARHHFVMERDLTAEFAAWSSRYILMTKD